MTEPERREKLLESLRDEWIIEHDEIDPEIVAGRKMPPDEWLNARLSQMGENWQFSTSKPVTISPTIIQQPAPEPKQATIAFSFWNDAVGENIQTKIATPIPNNEVEVTITAVNVSDVPAENVSLFIRACTICTWIQVPPIFVAQDPDNITDRTLTVPEMLPNLPLGKWKVKLSKQAIPRSSGFAIATYYACKNCPPINWKKPQILNITEPSLPLKLLAPSISYTPERVPK